MNNLDKRDVQLFTKMYETNKPFFGFTEDEYNSFKEKEYIVDKFYLNHDDFWEVLMFEFKQCTKEKVVNFFLNSLVTHDLFHRVGISAFSIMTHQAVHEYQSKNIKDITEETYDYIKHGGCKICGIYLFSEPILATVTNFAFLKGFNSSNYKSVYWYLKQTNTLEEQTFCKDSLQIFSDIMDTIVTSNSDDTPIVVQKKLKAIKNFKSNETERRELLDTLGYLSVLETKEHKGFFTSYNKLGHTPRKTHSSDWAYPVDFWTGKDGINKEAFKFWFGEYKELERFWK